MTEGGAEVEIVRDEVVSGLDRGMEFLGRKLNGE